MGYTTSSEIFHYVWIREQSESKQRRLKKLFCRLFKVKAVNRCEY